MNEILRVLKKKVTRRHLEAIWQTFWAILVAGVVVIGIILALVWLGQAGLLDYTTIVSVAVVEVGIGVFLYYFLGHSRRGSIEEMVNLLDVAEKISHLQVYKFSLLKTDFYYVENTETKEYYKAPNYIERMVDLNIIVPVSCKNEEEMKARLLKNGSHENPQEPTILQLLARRERKGYKRKHAYKIYIGEQ